MIRFYCYSNEKKGKFQKDRPQGNFRNKFNNDSKPSQTRNKRLVISEFESGLSQSKKKKKSKKTM